MNSQLPSKCVELLAVFLIAALLPDNSNAQSLCVQLTKSEGGERSVPVFFGSAMRLRFLHSIYGSQVEEVFVLQYDGFHLTQVRYGEARLADFYAHENARFDNGVWIVRPTPTRFPSLTLNSSVDTAMSLHFVYSDGKPLTIQSTGALRLTVASCKSSAHG